MKYVNQLQHPHMLYVTRTDPEYGDSGKTTTIKSSGCGLCSAIMVADRLLPSYDFELEDAVTLSYSVEANRAAGTSYSRFAPAFAEKLGLINAAKHDSQDICFVPDGDYAAFIELYTGKTYPNGDFVDENGKVLGEH